MSRLQPGYATAVALALDSLKGSAKPIPTTPIDRPEDRPKLNPWGKAGSMLKESIVQFALIERFINLKMDFLLSEISQNLSLWNDSIRNRFAVKIDYMSNSEMLRN